MERINKASVSLTLDTRRAKKEGKYPLKLRVFFSRKDRRYFLGIELLQEEFKQLSTSRKLRETWFDVSGYLKKAEKIITGLKDNFSFEQFENKFFSSEENKPQNQENLYDLFTKYSNELEKLGKISSADSYKTARGKLEAFLKETDYFPRKRTLKTCYLEDVSVPFLKQFEKYLIDNNISRSTIGIYTRNLRRIFNVAIADKKVSAELYPFGQNKFSPPASTKAKKALFMDDIAKIYNYKPVDKNEDFAKDIWLFCYYANGLNLRDVALLQYKNIKDDQIVFYRKKTIDSVKEAKEIYIFISPEIQEIINKWGNKKISDKTYIFDILTTGLTPRQEKERTLSARKKINKYMGCIAQSLELKIKPTTAHARHSFSTVLKRAGVGIEMISEQLGHSNIKTTEIYLDSFEKKQRQELSKHLLSFKNSGNEN